jgi:hypothetical protein
MEDQPQRLSNGLFLLISIAILAGGTWLLRHLVSAPFSALPPDQLSAGISVSAFAMLTVGATFVFYVNWRRRS